MRYLIRCLLINVCLCGSLFCFAAPNPSLSACLEKGKREFATHEYKTAKSIFTECLSIDPTHEETLLSLGGVSLTLEEQEQAKGYFLDALKYMNRNSAYLSYTYSMLGDIALKEQNNQAALGYYNKSLSFDEAYVNSLVGKGVAIENLGDKKTAAAVYQTALAVEPLNLVARRRLISLEPVYFTDSEILEALKQRYAVPPEQTDIQEKDRSLFTKIHRAEQRNGVTYLKEKLTNMPPNYVVTLFKGSAFAREVLTLKGYTALQKYIAQDAIAVFQKSGINIQDTFALRDLKGEKIFLPDNTLTDSGLAVYQAALKGKKRYLLPSEELPPTEQQLSKINAVRQQLLENGYTEITSSELSYLQQQTNCSMQTMQEDLGLYVLPVSRYETRYYVMAREVADPRKGALWHYVAKSRSQTNPDIIVPDNILVKKRSWIHFKLCSASDGKLYQE